MGKKKKERDLLSGFKVTTTPNEDGLDAFIEAESPAAEDILLIIAKSCGDLLDENEAINYVEFTVTAATDGRPKYVVTVQRHDKPTPHELRRIAEAERDALLSIGRSDA